MQRRSNVLPSLAEKHTREVSQGDSKLSGFRCTRAELAPIHLSKLLHKFARKLGSAVKFSLSFRYTSMAIMATVFSYCIIHVVLWRAEKEVSRIDTLSIVTSVTHAKTFGYRSECLLKRQSVSSLHNIMPATLPVAAGVKICSPFPTATIGSLVHSFPKPFPEGFIEVINSNLPSPVEMFCAIECHAEYYNRASAESTISI